MELPGNDVAAHLAARRFYERAHEDCRMIYDHLPSPKQMQTLVQVWKQLWKWRSPAPVRRWCAGYYVLRNT
jgi:hypothetical protein